MKVIHLEEHEARDLLAACVTAEKLLQGITAFLGEDDAYRFQSLRQDMTGRTADQVFARAKSRLEEALGERD